MLNKVTLILVVLFTSYTYAQKVIGKPDVNNLDKFIQEVYEDNADVLAPKGSKQYEFLKNYLKRIEYLDYSSIDQINTEIREITSDLLASTYTALNFDDSAESENFNPLKYKLDYNNNDVVYYFINKNFIIKIKPIQS